MIIDAKNMILGRIAAVAAKKSLLGEKVDIVNCEQAVVSGTKKRVVDAYLRKRNMGTPKGGPFIHRSPDRFVRRTVRGMLPYKQPKGRDAFKRVMCHIGMPDEFKDQAVQIIETANATKLPNLKFISVKEICKSIGGK
ncbi:MAG: 50S ribosomal protein L13 [Nanoarchaeota archaeon]|nr:50S ribosomal protein L13 [Nanoarchaeota archaeon]